MNNANNATTLANLPDVVIDKTLPVDLKIKDFVRQVDPYRYKVNGISVTAVYPLNAPSLENGYRRLKA